LHGDRDEVVPFDQGKRVFAAALEPKEFYTIRGSGHNDTYIAGGEDYFQSLKEFIDKAKQVVKPPR
ncbi:MAG TPA: alpha/beta hydrolase, partial [Candidatus Binatia bacterium]